MEVGRDSGKVSECCPGPEKVSEGSRGFRAPPSMVEHGGAAGNGPPGFMLCLIKRCYVFSRV